MSVPVGSQAGTSLRHQPNRLQLEGTGEATVKMDLELPKRHGDPAGPPSPLRSSFTGTRRDCQSVSTVTVTVAVSRTSDEPRLAKLPGCWFEGQDSHKHRQHARTKCASDGASMRAASDLVRLRLVANLRFASPLTVHGRMRPLAVNGSGALLSRDIPV